MRSNKSDILHRTICRIGNLLRLDLVLCRLRLFFYSWSQSPFGLIFGNHRLSQLGNLRNQKIIG